MAQDQYSPYAGNDVMDYLKELATNEADKFGAAKEPIQMYQQSQTNQEGSLKNINDSYSNALSDLLADTKRTQQEVINNILGSSNPLALNQAKLNVQNQQSNTLRNIRGKAQQDIDLYNKQGDASQTAFIDSLGYNKDFLSQMFNRAFEVQKDKAALARKDFDSGGFSTLFNNYINKNFKPIWSPEDYLAFKNNIKF